MKALIVGDSHVDWTPFASELQDTVSKLGYEVTRAGVGATSARSWLKDKTCRPNGEKCVRVSDLKKGGPWDLVLISLGTNDSANAKKAGKRDGVNISKRVQKLAKELGGSRTLWILPPRLRGKTWYTDDATNDLYASAHTSGLELFDSRPATIGVITKKSGDGIHPGKQVAKTWATAVGEHLKSDGGVLWIGLVAAAIFIWMQSRN